MMIHPVEVFEKLENERRSPEIVKSQMELSKLEKGKRSLVERASKGKATEEDIKNKTKEIAEYEPVKPLRLFVDDVTSEKLTSVLAENKGRAAVVSAEGGIFDIISGLYSRNVNIDVFLKGHSGDTIRVDRIGRASESIIHPALTMVLAVQPEVLNGLMSNNTFRGRGLTARFLYSMPKSTVGSRSFSTKPIPEGVRSRYQALIETILSGDNEQEPISLDDGAREVLEDLFNEIEGRLKGDLAEISDWAGKFVGAVLRISGILHVMKYPKDSMFDSVDRETMENAVAIGRYFLAHAKSAYSLMGADTVNKDAQYLLSFIKYQAGTAYGVLPPGCHAALPQFQDRRFSAARAEPAMRVWLHCRQAPGTGFWHWPPSVRGLCNKSRRTEHVTHPFRPLRPRGKGRSQSLRLFSPGNGPGSYAQKRRNQKGNYPGIKQGRF